MPRHAPTPAIERALSRRRIVPPPPGVDGDCWLYEGARKGQPPKDDPDNDHRKICIPNGRRGGRLDYVHRVSYRHYHGEIPEGINVRHKCDRRACFAPHHLELGTQKENFYDALMRGRCKAFAYRTQVETKETDECPF